MKSIRQLCRRPGKTLLGILLVALSSVLLCVSIGQFFAAVRTQREAERNYTTVALPTTKYMMEDQLDEHGNKIGVTWSDQQPPEVHMFLNRLPDLAPELVKASANNGLVSGYAPEVTPLNYRNYGFRFDGNYLTWPELCPNTGAMLVMTLEKIGESRLGMTQDEYQNEYVGDRKPEDYGVVTELTGKVTQVVALPDGYPDPVGWTLRVTLWTGSEAEIRELGLEVGKSCLVYGRDYVDSDWNLRRIVNRKGTEEFFQSITWDNLRMLNEQEQEVLRDGTPLVAVYDVPGVFYDSYLTEQDVNMMESCALTVYTTPLVYMGRLSEKSLPVTNPNGTSSFVTPEEYCAQYGQAPIAVLDTTAEEFLAETTDKRWQQAREELNINNHAFPVMTSPAPGSIAQFAMEDAFVTQGRTFTQAEYDAGTPVCMISETLAEANGLRVGDCISLQFYGLDQEVPDQPFLKPTNPAACRCSRSMGFAGDAVSFRITGLYRQKNAWSAAPHAFTPNTIWVPEKAVSCPAQYSDSGAFRTIVLENGAIDQMEQLVVQEGMEGLFAYYDQGYGAIRENLARYYTVSKMVFAGGVAAWLGLLLLFLFLFPMQQKREVRQMWSLGTPPKQIVRHITASGLGVFLPGAVLGGILGGLLLQKVMERIAAESGAVLTLTSGPWAVIGAVALQLILIPGVLALTAKLLIRPLNPKTRR